MEILESSEQTYDFWSSSQDICDLTRYHSERCPEYGSVRLEGPHYRNLPTVSMIFTMPTLSSKRNSPRFVRLAGRKTPWFTHPSLSGARDLQGNLPAGLTLDEIHHLRTYHVARMPAWIRMANRLLHVVPADGVLRQIQAGRIWFRPRQVAVSRYLRQAVRRRGRGTCLMVFLDGRGPVGSVINLKPRSIRTMMRTVVKTSIPILEDHRLIYPIFW
jgi:hypothetical protein